MIVYHRTHHAAAILSEGFRNGYYSMPGIGELRGIFVSADWPLDENEGANRDAVISIEIPERLFVKYEHTEEGKTYREAMIPADALNDHLRTAKVLAEDEVDALTAKRWER